MYKFLITLLFTGITLINFSQKNDWLLGEWRIETTISNGDTTFYYTDSLFTLENRIEKFKEYRKKVKTEFTMEDSLRIVKETLDHYNELTSPYYKLSENNELITFKIEWDSCNYENLNYFDVKETGQWYIRGKKLLLIRDNVEIVVCTKLMPDFDPSGKKRKQPSNKNLRTNFLIIDKKNKRLIYNFKSKFLAHNYQVYYYKVKQSNND